MTRTDRLEAAQKLYAERRTQRALPLDAPDRLALGPLMRTTGGLRAVECSCRRAVRWNGGLNNHLRGAAHIAGVFRVSVRELVAPFMSQPHRSRTALAAGERRLRRAYERKEAS